MNQGKIEYYHVLGINYSTVKRQRFSIVIKNEPLNAMFPCENLYPSTLYIRGTFESMKNILVLKECEKETLKEMIESFSELGYLTLIYGKKELTQEETEEYIKLMLIYKSSLTMEDYEVENIFSKFEENISFLSLICLEWKQEETANQIITSLKEAKIKTSFLSGGTLNNTLIGAYKSGILSSDDEFFHLNGENFDSILFGMKTILHKIKKTIEKNKQNVKDEINSEGKEEYSEKNSLSLNYYLLISLKTFCLIMDNKYLKSHFHFVLHLANGIIGYDFSPQGKKKLVKWVRSKTNGKKNILAIGFSICDRDMLSKPSFAIELIENNNISSCVGDLFIKNKNILNEIFFKESFVYNERFLFVLCNVFQLSLLLAWPMVFLHFFNESYFGDFIKHQIIMKSCFGFGFINIIILSFVFIQKPNYQVNKPILGICYFLKEEYSKNFPFIMINTLILSLIDSVFLCVLWSLYQYFHEQEINYPKLFLPLILQINSSIMFYLNVKFLLKLLKILFFLVNISNKNEISSFICLFFIFSPCDIYYLLLRVMHTKLFFELI